MNDFISSSKEDRTWAMVTHLATLAGSFIPLGNVLGPLIIWLIKREGSPFVDAHGKEALNFNLSVTIYAAISTVLIMILIGTVLLFGLIVFWIVCMILACIKANEGKMYRYPLTIRFIK